MKKWIRCMVTAVFLLFCIPPLAASAAAGGSLSAQGQQVTVMLQKPEGETGAVTALRFWLYVSGGTDTGVKPQFMFADTAFAKTPEVIQDASVSMKDGRYIIEIIMSGKDGSDIFKDGSQAVIGTLSLSLLGAKTEVGFAGEAAQQGEAPAIRYLSSLSPFVQAVPLSGVTSITSQGTAGTSQGTQQPGIIWTPGTYTPVIPPTPDTAQPGTPSTPDGPGPEDTGTGDGASQAFNPKTAPKLTLSAKNKSSRVELKWNKVAGADGYQIYQYQEAAGKYKRLKTILNSAKTAYSAKMEYGTAYKLKLRAFQCKEDGSRVYGKFSPAMQITTAPQKVKGLAAKKLKSGKIMLTWQPAGSHADGYQIYRSTKKNGTYSRIKTVAKGTLGKYSNISQKRGKPYYYKIRAYTVGADGERRYGKFSAVRAVAVKG